MKSRDRRFDGVFYTAVRTTGIYCRPSCPARTPASRNVDLPPDGGGRAGGRLPRLQALPARRDARAAPTGTSRPTSAGRAMRLIADGVVDREGVDGLAPPRRLHPAPPHPAADRRARRRPARPGPGPARADRAGADRDHRPDVRRHRVRGRLRQHPPVQRHRSARSTPSRPTELRGRRGRRATTGTVAMRLAVRTPFAGARAAGVPRHPRVPGVEAAGRRAGTPAPSPCRTAPAPSALELADARRARARPPSCTATFALEDLRDTAAGGRARPPAARRRLRPDGRRRRASPATRVLGPLVARRPRACACPATSTATRSPCAPCSASRSAWPAPARSRPGSRREHGRPVARPDGTLTHLFPDVATLAALEPESLPMPRARGRALVGLCRRPGRRRRRARPRRRPRRRPPGAARAARHRAVDRRLHRAARAR